MGELLCVAVRALISGLSCGKGRQEKQAKARKPTTFRKVWSDALTSKLQLGRSGIVKSSKLLIKRNNTLSSAKASPSCSRAG